MATWIQAIAAVAQALLAFALWRATTAYVKLTAGLVETNNEQLQQLKAGSIAERRARLARVRQLVDQIRNTLMMGLPERLSGGPVDRMMRNAPMWDPAEPRDLARLAMGCLPNVQYECREVVENLDWIAERVADVRRTTREQGFRYETIDGSEWHNRWDRAIKALDGIDKAANQLQING